MKRNLYQFWNIVKAAGSDFLDDNCTKLSASLAYFTIFSIGPLLMVMTTLTGVFYKKSTIVPKLFDEVSKIVGKDGANQLQGIMSNISRQNNSTLFTVIGTLVLIFGATGIFTEIQSSINYIWSIRAKPKKSWLKYILDRLLSFSLVIGCGFLFLVSLLINLFIDLLDMPLMNLLGDANTVLLKIINIAVMFGVVTFMFAIIYKVLPDASIKWKDAIVGAAFTGILFLVGKFLISYYLGSSTSISAYGAAASLIILLSWVYYSSLILYFGAEFTKIYAHTHGNGITINETAVFIMKKEVKEIPEADKI